MCTQLSAPGVPCGPGSGVREGWGWGWRKSVERRRKRRSRGQGPQLHLKLSNEIYNRMRLGVPNQISNQRQLLLPPPPPSCFHFRQTEETVLSWWVVWPDEERKSNCTTGNEVNEAWKRQDEELPILREQIVYFCLWSLKTYGFICVFLDEHEIRNSWPSGQLNLCLVRSAILCIWVKHSQSRSKCLEKGLTCSSHCRLRVTYN